MPFEMPEPTAWGFRLSCRLRDLTDVQTQFRPAFPDQG